VIFAHLCQSGIEVSPFFVEAVDKSEPGDPPFSGGFPCTGGTDLGAVDGIDNDQSRITGTDGAQGLTEKFAVSGGIDKLQRQVVPFAAAEGGINT
jgi:hypothetical protein